MRDLIRKILKESSNDPLQWAKDIPDYSQYLKVGQKIGLRSKVEPDRYIESAITQVFPNVIYLAPAGLADKMKGYRFQMDRVLKYLQNGDFIIIND